MRRLRAVLSLVGQLLAIVGMDEADRGAAKTLDRLLVDREQKARTTPTERQER